MSNLKQGWLILNDSVVVKEYVKCLNEYVESSADNEKKEKAINHWYNEWNKDRDLRKSNGEQFYPFSVVKYSQAIQEDQELQEEIKLINENSLNEMDDYS